MTATANKQVQTTDDCQRKFAAVCAILEKHAHSESKLIPILQEVQEEYRYLPADVLAYIATDLDMPPAQVYGVATFYAHFALAPKGKYIFRLCDGTACHVKGSTRILDALRAELRLTDQETTPDMLFTVETVSCLGACGLAPVMLMNEDVHGQVTPEKAVALVQELKAQEEEGQ